VGSEVGPDVGTEKIWYSLGGAGDQGRGVDMPIEGNEWLVVSDEYPRGRWKSSKSRNQTLRPGLLWCRGKALPRREWQKSGCFHQNMASFVSGTMVVIP
jgi:hypothetical protein